MKITEKDLRRLIREMALKSYTVLPGDESLGGEPVKIGDQEDWSKNTHSIVYVPSPPERREKEQVYLDRTYRQPGYRRTVERQYSALPFPVNIFVLPSLASEGSGRTGTGAKVENRAVIGMRSLENGVYKDDDSKIIGLLEKMKPGCTSVIEPGDATLIISPGGQVANISSYTAEELKVVDNIKSWRYGDGVYMAVHVMFDGGPLGDYDGYVQGPLEELLTTLTEAGYTAETSEILTSIFRVRTLRDMLRMTKTKRAGDNRAATFAAGLDTAEIFTVATLINKSSVNLNSFPTAGPNGEPLDEEIIARGNDAIKQIDDLVVDSIGKALVPGMITLSQV